MNNDKFIRSRPLYIALLLLLIQIILYHTLYEYVIIFNRIFAIPIGIPIVIPLLFVIVHGLYSKDVRNSFLFGFFSAVIFPVDLILTGKYVPDSEVSILVIIGIASGLAGVLAAKAAERYKLKFRFAPFVYLFSGTVSIIMGVRILLQLSLYIFYLDVSQWSHDAAVSLGMAIAFVVLGAVSIQWCGKNKYPRFSGNTKVQNYMEKIIAIGVLVLISSLFVLIIITLTQPQM